MIELEAIMKKQFSNNSSAKSSSFGGIKAAAQIMNSTKTALEASVMSGLEKIDPDLMLKIQDNMFTFENLVGVENKGIQVLMRNADPDLLMIALKGASEDVKAKFFGNMSERARGMFKDDMDAKGLMRIADVEDAQKQVMRIARKLSDSGELVLGGEKILSNPNAHAGQKPVWQPLPKLHPIEIHSVGFQKMSLESISKLYLRPGHSMKINC